MKYEITTDDLQKLRNYEYEERAAILEHDAHINKELAEQLAKMYLVMYPNRIHR